MRPLRRGQFVKWIILGILVGLLSGLGASVFSHGLNWAEFFFQDLLAGSPPLYPAGEHGVVAPSGSPYRPVVFFFLPALGGLISGFLVFWLAPEAAGAGTNAMIDAFHNASGTLRARVPLVKAVASIVTLATNGSAGRQGPIAQIGAGLGSLVGRILRLPDVDVRILLLAGAAGGLGALFRAPMGSAIICTEILYHRDIETEGIIPCVISAIVSYTTFSVVMGHGPIFHSPDFHFDHPLELAFYAGLGILCAPAGQLFGHSLRVLRENLFGRIRVAPHWKPAIGGLGVGMVGIAVPQALGIGFGWLQPAILGELSVWLMAAVVMAKFLATGFTISSGGSGGLFAPSLVIGGMLGGVVGGIGHEFFPQIVREPGAFVLVGMGGFFAGVANAPIGSILMICEMTGGYGLLVPLLLVSTLHLLMSRERTIFEAQVPNRLASPAHAGEITVNVLKEIPVRDVFQATQAVPILTRDMNFRAMRDVVLGSQHTDFPVVDREKRLSGIFSLNQIRNVLLEDSLADLVVVGEVASRPFFVTPEEDLHGALMKFLESGHDELPVVSDPESRRVLGMIRHEDVISAYHSRMAGGG